MSTVEDIKVAIAKLSLSERGELERWLHGWTDDEWDEQMKRDASAGRFDKILSEVSAEINRGDLLDFP